MSAQIDPSNSFVGNNQTTNSDEPIEEKLDALDSQDSNAPFKSDDSSESPSNFVQDARLDEESRRATAKSQTRDIRRVVIRTLSQLTTTEASDCYVQLVEKERRVTKEGKPFYKVRFRDRNNTANAVLWSDSALYNDCERFWRPGGFYKIRASFKNTNFGPQLELFRIREITNDDREDGFEENKCRPSSEVPPEAILAEILSIASRVVGKSPLLRLIQKLFKDERLPLCETAASRAHHRSYSGGLLEHTLSVTKLAIQITDHYYATNPELKSRINKPLVVAGAILHDVGKILDTTMDLTGPKRTITGDLIGHNVLGIELIHQRALEVKLDKKVLALLEHIILTHSRFQDWGAPQPPSSLEAAIVHYADYVDSTFASSLQILREDATSEPFTERKGPFGAPILKPMPISTWNRARQQTIKSRPRDANDDEVQDQSDDEGTRRGDS